MSVPTIFVWPTFGALISSHGIQPLERTPHSQLSWKHTELLREHLSSRTDIFLHCRSQLWFSKEDQLAQDEVPTENHTIIIQGCWVHPPAHDAIHSMQPPLQASKKELKFSPWNILSNELWSSSFFRFNTWSQFQEATAHSSQNLTAWYRRFVFTMARLTVWGWHGVMAWLLTWLLCEKLRNGLSKGQERTEHLLCQLYL